MTSKIQRITTTTVRVTRESRIELTGRQIAELVCREHGVVLPGNVSVHFNVPGGADWSNTAIDIDDDNPVVVEWKVVDEEETTS